MRMLALNACRELPGCSGGEGGEGGGEGGGEDGGEGGAVRALEGAGTAAELLKALRAVEALPAGKARYSAHYTYELAELWSVHMSSAHYTYELGALSICARRILRMVSV